MSKRPSVALALAALSWSASALATSDSGRSLRLLALAGPDQRHAIIADEDVQANCEEQPCSVFSIDLTRAEPKRRHREVIQGADPLGSYLQRLRRWTDPLRPLTRPATLRPLELREPASPHRSLALTRGDGSEVTVAVISLQRLESMAAYDRHSDRPCTAPERGQSCSTCQAVTRAVQGLTFMTTACRSGDGRWMDGSSAQPCDCHAQAERVALELRTADHRARGTEVLVEPFALGQNLMSGARQHETGDLELREHMLTAYETQAGALLVIGGAAHAPAANGTYYPMLAWLPPGARGSDLDESTRVSEPEGVAPAPVEVVPPSPPPAERRSACAGCTLSSRHPSAPLALLLGLAFGVLAPVRRR